MDAGPEQRLYACLIVSEVARVALTTRYDIWVTCL